MHLKQRINAFVSLGKFLREIASNRNNPIYAKSQATNGWFTPENVQLALNNWGEALAQKNLQGWVSRYSFEETEPKKIAVVMAGNIPLVGFHDFLAVLLTGNKVLAKLSSNDKVLLPFLANHLMEIEPNFKSFIEFSSGKLENFEAVIATGSNNTARYFDYYFNKYPHIIRKNRNSIAVLTGNETKKELVALANDIFQYFGLGCRNVSKLYVPENYNFDRFFKAVFSWKEIINNHKYINNYDYNKAVYLMDGISLLDNEFLLLKQDKGLSAPISVVFYERYASIESLQKNLKNELQSIQCIISSAGIFLEIPFGKAQNPQLWDYADGIDTVEFLLKLQ